MESKKIIVCDDQVEIWLVIQHLLKKEQFAILFAANGVEGLSLIKANKPNLLILDLDMPMKDGVSVLKEIQRDGVGGFYTIILTAQENQHIHEQLKALGANEVMVKPFHPGEFAKKIQGLVQEGKV